MLLQILVVVFLILLVVDRWKPKKFVNLHRQVGNDWPYYPVLGNTLMFWGDNEAKMTALAQSALQSYKRKSNAVTIWLGNVFMFGTADVNDALAVLKGTQEKEYMHKFLNHFIGNGSIVAPVNIWHRKRKVLEPTFAPRHVTKFVTVFESQSKVAADLLASKVGNGNFSCLTFINAYALDSVCETVFGVNIDIQRQSNNRVFKAYTEILRNIATRMCQPWLHIDAIYKRLPMYARHMELVKFFYGFVDDLIYKQKIQMNENKGTTEEANNPEKSFKTFLELMIENSEAFDRRFTDEELREESIVFSIAGTDTSALGASYTILMLSQHSDIQERVYREIREILDFEKPLRAEDLLKLKYTRAVINETLRLYPPVPFVTRHCANKLELPSGLVLPEDCDAFITIWGLHRNPKYWGEDANEFNPDRFMRPLAVPNAFMPFIHGGRNCVGQQYAMLSMTTVVVTLLRRYRFMPATNFKYDENNPLRLSFDIMMRHVDNYSVQAEYRK